jgi:hypothetical protein
VSSTFYEERRKDRAADRDADRADKREEREQRRKDRAEAEELRRRQERERRREAERRKAERRERRAALVARLLGEGDTVAALVVMACSITPAFYFQVSALTAVPGLPGFIAVCLAVMLEAGAWVATVAGERAKRQGRPVGKFRAAMWACAAVAAWINYSHAPASPGNWLAYVLAAASLGGVFFWELRGLGRHGGKAGRTLAERREAARRRRHALARRFRFRDVHKRYREIMTAHPFGTVDPEQAWADAWTDVKGGPLAVDARSLGRRAAAVRSVEDVVADTATSPEAAAVELWLAEVFPTSPGDDGTGDQGATGGPQGGPHGGGGTAVRTRRDDAADGATALGGIGKAQGRRTARKDVEEPLDAADLAAARKLYEAAPATFSTPAVARALGRSKVYAKRVRDAVLAEQQDGDR